MEFMFSLVLSFAAISLLLLWLAQEEDSGTASAAAVVFAVFAVLAALLAVHGV